MEFKTFSELENYSSKMKTFKQDEKVFVEEEGIYYQLDENNQWKPLKMAEISSGATIAEIKRSVLEEMGPLNEDELLLIPSVFAEYKKAIKQNFYMLICKDINYITLFKTAEQAKGDFSSEVYEIIKELGTIYDVGRTSDGLALEIWIKPLEDELRCFLLFGYDNGIVEFKRG
jgi:hypothetical protein